MLAVPAVCFPFFLLAVGSGDVIANDRRRIPDPSAGATAAAGVAASSTLSFTCVGTGDTAGAEADGEIGLVATAVVDITGGGLVVARTARELLSDAFAGGASVACFGGSRAAKKPRLGGEALGPGFAPFGDAAGGGASAFVSELGVTEARSVPSICSVPSPVVALGPVGTLSGPDRLASAFTDGDFGDFEPPKKPPAFFAAAGGDRSPGVTTGWGDMGGADVATAAFGEPSNAPNILLRGRGDLRGEGVRGSLVVEPMVVPAVVFASSSRTRTWGRGRPPGGDATGSTFFGD